MELRRLLFIARLVRLKSFIRLIKFSVKKYLMGKDIPGVAIFALTYNCQCCCAHCSAGEYKTSSPELDLGEWRSVIDEVFALGVPRIHISGGEPSLKAGFDDIVRYASGKGFLVFFETNAYQLCEVSIKRLKDAGVSSIDISLDSHCADIHDNLRGLKKSFERAVSAVGICRKLKVENMISTYATRENIASGGLRKLIMLAKELGAGAIRILPPQPSGRWLGRTEMLLSEKDRSSLQSQFPDYAVFDRTKLPVCPIKKRYSVFVSSDGEIQPCPHLPFSFGNVRAGNVAAALGRMAAHPMFEGNSICYICDQEFNCRFISPLLKKGGGLPVKVD